MSGTDQNDKNRHRVARSMYLAALGLACLVLGSTTARLWNQSKEAGSQSVLGVSRTRQAQEEAAAEAPLPKTDDASKAETAAAEEVAAATEADQTPAESADPGLLETGEDYVAMERSDLDAWAKDQGMTVTEKGNAVTYQDAGHKLVVTMNDAGNCVRLTGTASGTAKEQYDWYEDYCMFVLTGEIYGRCEGLLVTLRDGSSSDLSLVSRSSAEDGVEVSLEADGSTSTLTIDRPSGGPFIEF